MMLVVGLLGEAEVENLDLTQAHAGAAFAATAFQPDVGGLDVAVDQILFMGGRQSLCDLTADPRHFGNRQFALALQAIVERFAFEKLDGQKRDAAVLADLEDVDDVFVLELGGGAGLAHEAVLGRGVASDLRQHRLEGDLALESRVLRQKDDAHAAAASTFSTRYEPSRPSSSAACGGLSKPSNSSCSSGGAGIVRVSSRPPCGRTKSDSVSRIFAGGSVCSSVGRGPVDGTNVAAHLGHLTFPFAASISFRPAWQAGQDIMRADRQNSWQIRHNDQEVFGMG